LENAHILSVTVEEQFAPNVKESLRDLYAGEISAGQLTIASDARTIHIRAADDELLNQIQSIIRDWEDQAKERRVVGESVEAEEAAKQRQQLEELQRLAADQLQSDAPTPSSNAALQPGAGLGLSPAKSLETDSRVFLLKYIPAADAEQLVSLVLPVAVRADQRTNSLVVAGSAEKLEAVERLLESLDAPAPPTPAVVEAAQRAQAQKHLEDARREVTNRALQWLEQTQRPDAAAGAERDERLKELHDAVAEEFRLRQQQQELEVQALEARLQSLRRVIQYREQIREEVIRRRVEELLDPLADGGADGRDQIGAGPRAAAVVQ
jgi:type II secretory pathway component GspD/PulD (secretin)